MKLKAASLLCALLLWTAIGGCPGSDLGTNNATPGENTSAGGNDNGDSGATAGDQAGNTQNDGNTDGSQDTGDGGQDVGDGAGSGNDTGDQGDTGGTSGNDNTGNTGGDTADLSAFAGTFAGQLACTKSESVQGGAGPNEQWNADLTLTFDASGYPTGLTVPAYMQNTHHMLTFDVQVAQVGDEVSVTETAGDYTATLTARVTEATYTATTGHIVLALTHDGIQGALTEDGTGTFTVDYTLSGDALRYAAVTEYEVTMTNVISLNTTWGLDCDGTLTRQ